MGVEDAIWEGVDQFRRVDELVDQVTTFYRSELLKDASRTEAVDA